ncbi:uncharacterized protein PG986_010601 [Apiospora aurea]|uniref:Uncharacterized protein n=1 Tax=Apiospora aurea TaxID=335848 RepID=A0ABR1Q2S2_9PEZI
MPAPSLVSHPETGQKFREFSWSLYQSAADLALIDKARANLNEGTPLSDQDREQLLAAFRPVTGKAMAYPTSLTPEERRAVVGWPDNETRQANLEAVGLGHMTAEKVMAKVHEEGAGWMTLEQANLVRQRFNARPLDAFDWSVERYDKSLTVKAVQTEEEGKAYDSAQVRWRELSGLSLRQDIQRTSQQFFAERAAKLKGFEERRAKGQLTARDLEIEESKEKPPPRERGARAGRRENKGGVELMDLVDEYWAQAADWRDGFFRGKKARVFRRALKKTLEGEANEFDVVHRAVTGEKEPLLMRSKITTDVARELVAPAAAAASVFRHDHRRNRWQENRRVLPRYFLVRDRDGFPPLDSILMDNKVVLPEVWVYDAEWEPPADGDGVRDADGYEGRLKFPT